MIVNKMPNDPLYYKDWDIFAGEFPQETAFICAEFKNLCKLKRQITGKSELMNILNNSLREKFPCLWDSFQRKFPRDRLDRYLGIGLWNIIELDSNQWKWDAIYDQKGIFQTKIYTKI
jgi:hypothetical protein